MIGFFPEPYPDELLYSRICRYHKRTGYAAYLLTCDDIYRKRTVHPDIEFINAYTDDALSWITGTQTFSEVIEKQTMFPAYVRFLPKERRTQAHAALLSMSGNWNNLLCIPNTGLRYLRYCPICAREDRQRLGETYWHREHQLQRIRLCPKHRCFLEDSTIPIVSKSTPGFYDAEAAIPYSAAYRSADNEAEISLTDYALQVFRAPIDLCSDAAVGALLHSRLGCYVNDSGLVRDIDGLYQDYKDFYGDMPLMERAVMQKIFNQYRFDNLYIIQLAFFLGISVHALTRLPAQEKLYGLDALYKELSEKYALPVGIVQNIGNETLKYTRERTYMQRASGVRSKQYDELDEKLLPAVRKCVAGILHSDTKPQKLSFALVQRELHLPQKQINQLPKCYRYIQKRLESQDQFHARVIQWSVNDIDSSGCSLNLKQISKRFYLRRSDVVTALPYIKDERLRSRVADALGKL